MSEESNKTHPMSQKMRDRVRKKRKRLAISLVCFIVILAVALTAYFVPPRKLLPAYSFETRQEGELRIHFPSVGQGDSTIVEFPDGELLVIDAGDGSFSNTNKLIRYIKGLKPKSVSMLLTHADHDHYGGFESLLKVFKTEKFYFPVLGTNTDSYASLEKQIKKTGCETEILTRYGVIGNASGARLVAISPYSDGETDGNDASTVLYLEYGGVTALFSGDITASRERTLAEEYTLDESIFDSGENAVRLDGVNIFKVSHHGSGSSSSEEWLSLIKPETAIISCGAGNAYAHPSGEALARLKNYAEIYRLDELGDIVISVKDGSYTIGGRS